jgi:tRNA threonylcarbamoyladenosine biosynthesis protein TsaE
MSLTRLFISSRSAHQTQLLGKRIGELCRPNTILALTGDLGCGKTTLVQGLARGLGVPADYYITSPTYTWINEYPGRIPLFHVDLYRLTAPEDVEDIGLAELFHAGGTVAVEWADKIGDLMPARRLTLSMQAPDDTLREMQVSARGDKMVALLNKLKVWIKEQKWV